MTSPTRSLIATSSPTLNAALAGCKFRVAYSRDPVFKVLNRPNPRSSLGSAAHVTTAEAWTGPRESETANSSPKAWLAEVWDHSIHHVAKRLASAWSPAIPPSAEHWPGYVLTRMQLLIQLLPMVEGRWGDPRPDKAASSPAVARPGKHVLPGLPWIERELKDPASELSGTPDRVERRGDGRVYVVDLKAGIHQQAASPAQLEQLSIYAHLVRANGLALPEVGVIVNAGGAEQVLPLTQESVDAVLAAMDSRRREYNGLITEGVSDLEMANASPETCRGCPFRAVCGPFHGVWEEEWAIGRGVRGTLRAQKARGDTWEVEVDASSPPSVAGQVVRLSRLPRPTALSPGAPFSAFGTDVLGSPLAQGARWSTLFWPLLGP